MTAADGPAEPIEVFKFPEEVVDAAEAGGMEVPFAVVGSRECESHDTQTSSMMKMSATAPLPLGNLLASEEGAL